MLQLGRQSEDGWWLGSRSSKWKAILDIHASCGSFRNSLMQCSTRFVFFPTKQRVPLKIWGRRISPFTTVQKNNLAKDPEDDLLWVLLKEKSHHEFHLVKGLFELAVIKELVWCRKKGCKSLSNSFASALACTPLSTDTSFFFSSHSQKVHKDRVHFKLSTLSSTVDVSGHEVCECEKFFHRSRCTVYFSPGAVAGVCFSMATGRSVSECRPEKETADKYSVSVMSWLWQCHVGLMHTHLK